MATTYQVEELSAAEQGAQVEQFTASQSAAARSPSRINVGQLERVVSGLSGAILIGLGVRQRGLLGWTIAGVGGAMLERAATGHCRVYQALNMNSADGEAPAVPGQPSSIHVVQATLVDKPQEELYAFWRDLENLPRVLSHVRSVRKLDERRSHWTAETSGRFGREFEWECETIEDRPNGKIRWQSVPGSMVQHSGAIAFRPAPGDRGTLVTATIDYSLPGGKLAAWVLPLLGQSPDQQIREDLRTFKRMMEVGEALTVDQRVRGSCRL